MDRACVERARSRAGRNGVFPQSTPREIDTVGEIFSVEDCDWPGLLARCWRLWSVGGGASELDEMRYGYACSAVEL